MELAQRIAKQSHCISKKIGCVIVKDTRIISIGYNGTPSGYINCDQYFEKNQWIIQDNQWRMHHHNWSNIHQIHAEMNAIMFAAKNGISVDGATLYCNYFPCQHCLKNLVQTGIIRIVYKNEYDLGQYDQEFLKFITNNMKIELYQE